MDNGSTIDAVTPEFVEAHTLDISPLSNLVNGTMSVNGFGGLFSWPLDYVIMRVQVEEVWDYKEDQMALVIPDTSEFGSRVSVTLGTQTINQIINVINESEMDKLSVSLNGSRISHLLASHQAEFSIESEEAANQTMDPTDLKEAVRTTKKEEINTFSSKIIHTQTKTMFLSSNMHVITQTLEKEDGSCLPHGLNVMNTYTEMTTRSKWVVVMVKNWTTALITITKSVKVTWVVATNAVPQVEVALATLEKLDEMQGVQRVQMLTGQTEEAFFQQLDLSGLEWWSAKSCAAACTLLAEYHDIFSFEPGELGCTNLAKHEIKVIDDEPFKERFCRWKMEVCSSASTSAN